MQFQTYPFEKLSKLLESIEPNRDLEPINLTIGEPQFQTPDFIQDELKKSTHLLNRYPKSAGSLELKDAILEFNRYRFNLNLKNSEVIPTLGTREVLFNFPQFLLSDRESSKIAFTNPFYQIYEGAAIASNSKVEYINLTKANSFKAEIRDSLKDCDLIILNFPNNPTASTLTLLELREWVEFALENDIILLNDECYSEIYLNEAPPSLLQASIEAKNENFKNILVVNSISKRSSAPSLRSGYIAGDSEILKEYMRYRTYVGCASPEPLQVASSIAWRDDSHVELARDRYRANFNIFKDILDIEPSIATFYVWLEVGDDLEVTKELYKNFNLKVLPGSFLGRDGVGEGFIRVALVESLEKIKESAYRVKKFLDREGS